MNEMWYVVNFLTKVEKTDSCWLWMGALDTKGYGKLTIDKKTVAAHRASFVYHKGPIPDELCLDHICEMVRCVNPDHLEAVTYRANSQRIGDRRGTCRNGHPYSEANTRIKNGKRICRVCQRLAATRARERRAVGI